MILFLLLSKHDVGRVGANYREQGKEIIKKAKGFKVSSSPRWKLHLHV